MSLKYTMGVHQVAALFLFTILIFAKTLAVNLDKEPSDSQKQDLLMRGAKPEEPEAYLCTAYPISDQKSYIYKFEALANAGTVHHMILFGCNDEPFSTEPIWKSSSICKSGSQTILFAWAKNAPPTVLPQGVGFRIGKATTIKTIVLQVHYAKAFQKEEKPDHSGIRIYTTHEEQPFVAGIYLMAGAYFKVPANNPSYPVDVSCAFTMKHSIFPFAYRTHAHSLGKVITGYVYNGSYYEIGKGNPKWPQSFYPVHDKIEIKSGDTLAARCTYDSTSMQHDVSVGSTGNDEMCNFYIMFYTDSSVLDPSGVCLGNNKPELTGSSFPLDVSEPLPPNPDLEEKAKGAHHHGSMMGTSNPETQSLSASADTWTKDLLMRGAKPNKPDSYLCTAYPVTEDEAYVYKFEALANASTVHHILVYGCNGEPFSDEPIWRCPPMCKNSESTILFAWAKNAPPTVLPKDVGLRIGQKSTIKVIVLQVHYARVFPAEDKPDNSGIRIYVTHKKQPFVAGIFLLASAAFSIPPGESSYPVDISCAFSMTDSIFPFAYRTHAHGLGRVITGYQFNGSYHEIGKGNPQWPQAFYPATEKIEIKPGDHLAARCTYDSTSMKYPVSVGSTGNDEMCNFYIMFYTDSSVEDPSGGCEGDEVNSLTGNNFPADVSVPLPPNPLLEEKAKGHHQGHQGGSDGEVQVTAPADARSWDLIMRGAKPEQPQSSLCTAYPVADLEAYIYKFEALANMSTVHHIVVFGCNGDPISNESLWKCELKCKSGEVFLMYAWTKDAPPTVFPQGVGMRIGQQTQIKTIVLQVHYARSFAATDPADYYSGIRIFTTQQKQPFVAGVYLMEGDKFHIPPGNPSYPVDISCKFSKEKSIFPFLYSVHAHSLGKVIAAYHYNGSYHEIVKGTANLPQMFYPIKEKIEVMPGDYFVARCIYDSTSVNHLVSAGQRGNDEMCNVFIMFYTDSSEKDLYETCSQNNEPQLTGSSFPLDVSISEPSNPNPTKPTEHHKIQSEGGDSNHNAFRKWKIDTNSFDILCASAQNEKNNIHQEEMSALKNQRLNSGSIIRNIFSLENGMLGNSGEIMQYDYDLGDLVSEGVAVEKRQHQKYIDDSATSDQREPGADGIAEEGLSRNRNKEFNAINQQLRQFPHKTQHTRPSHKHISDSADNTGGSNAEQMRPPLSKFGLPLEESEEAGGNAAAEERDHSRELEWCLTCMANEEGKAPPPSCAWLIFGIHFEHILEFNSSWPSEKLVLGQIGGVATDSDGNVYIFHRGSREWNGKSFSFDNDFMYQDSPILEDVIIVLNSQGQLLRRFGAREYFMPHGIEVDKNGNIWLTDVAMHQVFKISRGETKPSLVLGHRFKHSQDLSYFCKPTDVAVLSSGEFFVSDGYCNARILKFSKDGTLIKTWGERSPFSTNLSPVNTFEIPHSITVSGENQLVCVADRENGRVQCFDLNGNFRHVIKHPEFGTRLFAIEQSPSHGGVLYAVNGPSFGDSPEINVQGFTLDIKTGDILENWNVPQHLRNPHDLCVHEGSQSVYVGELNPQTVWKLSRSSKPEEPIHIHIPKKPDDTSQNEVSTVATVPSNKDDRTLNKVPGTDQNIISLEKAKGPESDSSDLIPILVGCLLVIPVILLLIIILLIRAHKSGKLKCLHGRKQAFSLQGLLGNSHKGFDPLNTEESDHDSDHEEYLATEKIKSKP